MNIVKVPVIDRGREVIKKIPTVWRFSSWRNTLTCTVSGSETAKKGRKPEEWHMSPVPQILTQMVERTVEVPSHRTPSSCASGDFAGGCARGGSSHRVRG